MNWVTLWVNCTCFKNNSYLFPILYILINIGRKGFIGHCSVSGYYAPNGSVAQIECSIGTYNPFPVQAECIICEPGFYCPRKALDDHIACPVGKYCENGTYVVVDCPPGTYSNV